MKFYNQTCMNIITRFSSVSIIIALAVISVGAFFVSAPLAFAFDYSSGDVIVNEFVTNTDAGVDQWYELLNTTSSDIDLTDWVLSSAINGEMNIGTQLGSNSKILPANGLIVISVAYNPADDAGDVLQIKSPTTAVIHAVSYGDQPEPAAPNHADAPGNGESAAFASGAWSVGTPTKGWFNDAGEPEKAPLLSTIDSTLADAEIDSNIGELENPSATPATEPDALYFEKSGKGKIVFVQSLNLSSQTTVASLQSLGAAMEMLDGHIAFDSETAAAMDAMGAKIYMYGLDALGYTDEPSIIVRDDDGVVIDPDDENYPELSSIDFSGGTLTFTTDHFTQFDVPKVVNTTTQVGYETIQDAVTAASPNDIIQVADGDYPENVSIPAGKDGLTLQAAHTGEATIDPASGIGIALTSSSNVVIKGFNITTTGTDAHGIWVAGTPNDGAAVTGLVVQDNVITVHGYSSGIYAEQADTTPHSGWTIGGVDHGNTISVDDNNGNAVTGDGMDLFDVSNSEVSYNEITLTNPPDTTPINWSSELSNLSSLTFDNNTVSGSTGSEVWIGTDFIDSGADTSVDTVEISNNTFGNWGSRALKLDDSNSGDGALTNISIDTNTFNMSEDLEVIGGSDGSAAGGTGNTFNVENDSVAIQKAVDSARSGDTINVAAGTYEENLTVNKNLTLVGTDGAADTTINGDSDAVLSITSDVTVLEISGFTITGGGKGITTSGSLTGATVNIHDVIVTGNTAAGIYLSGDDAQLVDTTVTIADSEISDNTGGGIYIDDMEDSTAEISGNTIDGNGLAGIRVDLITGGIVGSTLTITGNTITNNGTDNTGIHIDTVGNAEVSINENTIEGNIGDGLF